MYKITIYLKSGQTITFKCKDYKFTFDSTTLEYNGYKLEEIQGYSKVNLVPSQISAYTVN